MTKLLSGDDVFGPSANVKLLTDDEFFGTATSASTEKADASCADAISNALGDGIQGIQGGFGGFVQAPLEGLKSAVIGTNAALGRLAPHFRTGAAGNDIQAQRKRMAQEAAATATPIVNRFATSRLDRDLMSQLEARSLTPKQREQLVQALEGQARMSIWACHNRHEAEPSAFQRQVPEALEVPGHKAKYFGGMTNAQAGIEISGDPAPEKKLLMAALAGAAIPFTNIVLTHDLADIGGWQSGSERSQVRRRSRAERQELAHRGAPAPSSPRSRRVEQLQ